jgi:O-antigen ligase
MNLPALKKSFADDRQQMLFAMLAFLFFLSLSQTVSTVFLVFVILLWIKNKTYRGSMQVIKQNKGWLTLMVFYVFHIVSLLWTENFRYAFFDLQIKMAYVICPLVFAGLTFSEADWKKFRKAFIAGCTVAAFFCLCHALWQYYVFEKKEYFFHEKFSLFMHPTYFMMYLNLAMLFILYDLFWKREEDNRWRKYYSAALFFQLIAIFLLSARTALATSLITFLIYCVIMARKKKLGRKDALPIFLFFAFAIIFQLGVIAFYNRYNQITKLIEQPDTKEENSTSIRYNLWKIAVELIKEKPMLGVGIGDIKEELVKKYEEHGYEYGVRNRISPHNQYLHTAVILGLVGMCILIFVLLYSFVLAWRNGDWIFALFIVIVALNGLTEGVLERQAGILFFAFFNSLFATRLIGTKRSYQ